MLMTKRDREAANDSPLLSCRALSHLLAERKHVTSWNGVYHSGTGLSSCSAVRQPQGLGHASIYGRVKVHVCEDDQLCHGIWPTRLEPHRR
jgi:hypothetical protein